MAMIIMTENLATKIIMGKMMMNNMQELCGDKKVVA